MCYSWLILISSYTSYFMHNRDVKMDEIWNNWSSFEQLMICIALFFTLIFIIQVVLTFSGFSIDSFDTFGGLGDDGVSFFTIRNMVSFFACLGWTAFILSGYDISQSVSFIAGSVVGLFAMFLNFIVIRAISKLSENNAFDIKATIGAYGTTYTPITLEKPGLVHISYGGGLHEVYAKSDTNIPSHTPIVVAEVLGSNLVLVKSL